MKVLFVLQYDSFIKTLTPVYDQLCEEQIEAEIVLYKHWRKQNWISKDIIKLLENYEYKIQSKHEIFNQLKEIYDIVIIGTTGGKIIRSISKYRKRRKVRIFVSMSLQ